MFQKAPYSRECVSPANLTTSIKLVGDAFARKAVLDDANF